MFFRLFLNLSVDKHLHELHIREYYQIFCTSTKIQQTVKQDRFHSCLHSFHKCKIDLLKSDLVSCLV